VALVVAFVPDLLFGSNVVGAVRAAGHEPSLVPNLGSVDPTAVDLLVIDLTDDAVNRIAAVHGAQLDHVPTLAFYSHVETDVRSLAVQAGFDLVVPRSRMAREGASLIERLLAPDQ
jgi:hypothetical protein